MYRITNQIKEFIKNKEDVLKLPMLPLAEYNMYLDSLGYTNDGDWFLEGWQGYFKIKYNDYNLHDLELSGSLFYGNYELRKV